MRNYFKNRLKVSLLVILSLTSLIVGFYYNFWKAADQEWFNHFQYDSESLILGRISLTENEGIFSMGGLLGRFSDFPEGSDVNLYQYDIYRNSLETDIETYSTYDSQTGGQAILFTILNKLSPFSNSLNLKLFKFLTSLLTATILSIILVWLSKQFGYSTTLIVLLLLIFSQWLTVFGRNLFWSLWSFYIPYISLTIMLFKYDEEQRTILNRVIFIVVLISVLIKCFFTGMEYITTTLIMLVTPLFYYAVKNKWKFMELVKYLLTTTIAALLAVLVSFSVIIKQISAIKGSVSSGIEHIQQSFTKRTYGGSDNFSDTINESVQSGLGEVLSQYWTGIAIDLNNIFSITVPKELLRVGFGELIITIGIFSIIGLLLSKIRIEYDNIINNFRALVLTCWFSVLAPLSWFIMFKGHSFIHTHMNHIIWYMPFLIFGFSIIGYVLIEIIRLVINPSKERML